MTFTDLPIIAVFRGSVSGIRWGADDTGVGSFLLISGTGAGDGAGGALAGRGAGGSSLLFHMLI
jgi:hypothetical protein